MKTKKKAFTLTELLVIVIVIGVLSAVVLPKFSKVLETRKTTEAEDVMAAVRTEQERRCALDQKYFSNISSLSDIVPNTSTKNFDYSLQSEGAGMLAHSKGNYSYNLRMLSFADGRVCCEGDDCSKLNKDYESCSELPNKSDFNDGAECLMTVEPTPENPILPIIRPVIPIYFPVITVGKSYTETAACGCQGTHQRSCNTLTNTCDDWSECQYNGMVIPDEPCPDPEPDDPEPCPDMTQSILAQYSNYDNPSAYVGNGGGVADVRAGGWCCLIPYECQGSDWVVPVVSSCEGRLDAYYCGTADGGSSSGGGSGGNSGSSGAETGGGCSSSARPPNQNCCCNANDPLGQNNLQEEKAFSFYYAASIGGGGAGAVIAPEIPREDPDDPRPGQTSRAFTCHTLDPSLRSVGSVGYQCYGNTWKPTPEGGCAAFPC